MRKGERTDSSRQAGTNRYLLARKAPKLYMKNVFTVKVNSITTAKEQILCIDQDDVDFMRGKRVLIVDDVISTGESLRAVEELVHQAGGLVVGRMAILAEGDATERDDILYLEKLPLFNADVHLRPRLAPRADRIFLAAGALMVVLTLTWINLSRLFSGMHSYA